MRASWPKALAALAAIWVIAGAGIWWARGAKATPESVVRYADEHPLDGKSHDERAKTMRKLADQLNQLEYEQRHSPAVGKRMDAFFRSLTPEEQGEFFDLTVPAGFKQMMDAFNKMAPAKRKQFVERALADMKKRGEEEAAPPPDDPHVQKMIAEGLHAFYTDASAETKLDLAPLMEQIQKNLQGLR